VAQGYSGEGKSPMNISDGPVEISEDIAGNNSASNTFFGPTTEAGRPRTRQGAS
jgi:hypothetical protein